MTMTTTITTEEYLKKLGENILAGSVSKTGGHSFFPPKPIDPTTGSMDMEWIRFSGEGTLETFTIVYIAPTAMIQAGYGRDNPYCVGIVRVKEGPLVSARIAGVDVLHPETIRIGSEVRLGFETLGSDGNTKALPVFRVV
jgi:uncharacterized OB-fold protein